ncbi:MAG: YihY/virulence factor BrkB family protein [Myxococcota bacterium]
MQEPDAPVSERQRMSLSALPPQLADRAHALLGTSHRGRVSLDVLDGALEGDVLRAASAMAFDLFLAAIPLLALAGWVFGHLLRAASAATAVSLLLDTSPAAVRAIAEEQLSQFSPTAIAPLGLIGSLWLSSSAAATCMALLEARGGARPRPWYTRRLIAMACVLAGIVVFGAGSAFTLWIVGGPIATLEAIAGARVAAWTRYALGLSLLHLLVVLLLALFMRVAVHRPSFQRRRIFPGALLGSVLCALASLGFTFYATRVAGFALYYGGLAAVAITLVWLWLMCLFILVGAELNLVLEGGGSAGRALEAAQSERR